MIESEEHDSVHTVTFFLAGIFDRCCGYAGATKTKASVKVLQLHQNIF